MEEYDFDECYSSSVLSTSHHFYISDAISTSEVWYNKLLSVLRDSGEDDCVTIHINSVGGELAAAAQIIQYMDASSCMVITSAEGNCYSAASLILMRGDGIAISKHCEILLHDGSGGETGKVNENLLGAKSTKKILSNLYHEVYGKFFTRAEINRVLKGEDKYLTGNEMLERVSKWAQQQEDDERVLN